MHPLCAKLSLAAELQKEKKRKRGKVSFALGAQSFKLFNERLVDEIAKRAVKSN